MGLQRSMQTLQRVHHCPLRCFSCVDHGCSRKSVEKARIESRSLCPAQRRRAMGEANLELIAIALLFAFQVAKLTIGNRWDLFSFWTHFLDTCQ